MYIYIFYCVIVNDWNSTSIISLECDINLFNWRVFYPYRARHKSVDIINNNERDRFLLSTTTAKQHTSAIVADVIADTDSSASVALLLKMLTIGVSCIDGICDFCDVKRIVAMITKSTARNPSAIEASFFSVIAVDSKRDAYCVCNDQNCFCGHMSHFHIILNNCFIILRSEDYMILISVAHFTRGGAMQ